MQPDVQTLTLQDIADLARVQRPVVSMWRKRGQVKGDVVPFPPAAGTRGRVEHFNRDEIVAWLERTGRGNNPDFRLDAVGAAVPAGAELDDLLSLLCLRVLADRDLAGLDADELADLADEFDPDDESFFAEVEALGERAVALTPYVDSLAASAFSPADALDRLETGRLRREAGRPEYANDAVRLVGVMSAALASWLVGAESRLVDGSEGRSRLALQAASAWQEGACQALGVAGDAPAARRQRRAARLRGLAVETEPEGSAVVVMPVAGVPHGEAIRAIDELQLALPGDQVIVVIGAASLLCDPLREGDVEADRDAIVRTGKLRLAARLPRGLYAEAPRQHLAIWVLGAPQTADPIEERAAVLADLSQHRLDDAALEGLATDAVASVGDFRAHSFTFGRLVKTSRVIAARVVVPPAPQPTRLMGREPSAEVLLRVEDLCDRLDRPPARLEIGLRARRASANPPSALGELLARGQVLLKRGARLDLELAREGGSVRLFDPAAGITDTGFDPIDLELHNARALRTEPGDVVFTHTPRPAASVDPRGGSVVSSPARILRVAPDAPVGPYCLARTINRQPPQAREWQAWLVDQVPAAELEALEAALARLADVRTDLARRLKTAEALEDALIHALAAGAATLTPEDEKGS